MMQIILSSAFLFFATVSFAQSKNEKAVTTAVGQLYKALVDGDSAMLVKLTLPQLSYGHSGGQVDDKKAFVEKIASGKSDFVTIALLEQTVLISKNVALVRHKLKAETNDNARPGTVHLAVLLVWQKLHGQWKLLTRQAVKIQ